MIKQKNCIKFYISLHASFHLAINEEVKTEPPIVLNTSPTEALKSSNPQDLLRRAYEDFEEMLKNFTAIGSGWVLRKLLALDLHILEYKSLHPSSYICLPEEIAKKKAIVNIKNKLDQKCFLWSVIAGTFLKNSKLANPHRLMHYRNYENKFNLEGIKFPVSIADIPKFERRNDITISVYGCEAENLIYPIKVSKEKKKKHVNLLLISDEENQHYCNIKDFNRLIGSQYSNSRLGQFL